MPRDIHVEITSDFNASGFNNAIKAVDNLHQKLSQVNKLMSTSGSSGFATGVKNAVNTMNQLTTATNKMSQATKQASSTKKAQTAQMKGFTAEMQKATALTNALGKAELSRAATARNLQQAQRNLQAAARSTAAAERQYQALMRSGTATARQKAAAQQQLTNAQRQEAAALRQLSAAERSLTTNRQAYTRAKQQERVVIGEITRLYRAQLPISNQLANTYNNLANQIKQFEGSSRQVKTLDTQFKNLSRTSEQLGQRLSAAKLLPSSLQQRLRETTTRTRELARAEVEAGRQAAAAAAQMRQLASVLLNSLTRGAISAANALNRIGAGIGQRFGAIRSALASTGTAALLFGRNVQSGMVMADRAIERTTAGWSLLMAGNAVRSAGMGILKGGGLNFQEYMEFEKAVTRTAISGSSDNQTVSDLVFGIQRGDLYGENIGQPVFGLSSQEIAQGTYYLTSALGLPLVGGRGGNLASISDMLLPMLQVAQYTQTAPETVIKGAANIGMQFGLDPRDLDNSQIFGNIAATMGYLANISTLEVPDIRETFKMVGPLFNRVSGGNPMENILDAMTAVYFSSEVGLSGGRVGRGIDRAISQLLDPSQKSIGIASEIWGIEDSREGWTDFWFDDDMKLKGGFMGVIDKFMDPNLGPMADQLLASLFTQNATRNMIGIIAGMREGGEGSENWEKWLEIEDMLRMGDYGNAMRLMQEATQKTNETVFGAVQNMKNAWMGATDAIVGSIKGDLMGALGFVADLFWEIRDIVKDFPVIGRLFTIFASGAGVILAVIGSLLTFAGVLLVLQRAFLFTSGAGSLFLGILAGFPHILGLGLGVMLAFAAAAVLLYSAWEANLGGLRDFTDALGGDFSAYFGTAIAPRLESIGDAVLKTSAAFVEFFRGIVLGIGETQNLGAWLADVFGPLLGPRFYGQLLNLKDAFADLRGEFGGFMDDATSKFPGFNALYGTFIGFLEETLLGVSTLQNQEYFAQIGEWLKVDDLGANIESAALAIRGYFAMISDALSGPLANIKDSIDAIFEDSHFDRFISFLTAIGQGAALGAAATITAIARAIEYMLAQVQRVGSLGTAVADLVERFTGLRISLENVGHVIGLVLGVGLATWLLFSIPLVDRLASGVLRLALMFVQLAAQVVVIGLQAAAFLAAAAAQSVYIGARLLATAADSAATAAISGLVIATATYLGVVLIVAGVLLGIAAVILGAAAATLVYIAATEGLSAAFAALVQFVEGVWIGIRPLVNVLLIFAGIIYEVIGAIGSFLGVSNNMRAMGIALGSIFSILGAILIGVVVSAVYAAVSAFVAWLVAMGPIVLIVGGIIAAIALLAVGLSKLLGFDSVFDMLASGFNYVKDAVIGVTNAIKDMTNALIHGSVASIDTQLAEMQAVRRDYLTEQQQPHSPIYKELVDWGYANISEEDLPRWMEGELPILIANRANQQFDEIYGASYEIPIKDQYGKQVGTRTGGPADYRNYLLDLQANPPKAIPDAQLEETSFVQDLASAIGLDLSFFESIMSGDLTSLMKGRAELAEYDLDNVPFIGDQFQAYTDALVARSAYEEVENRLGPMGAQAFYEANDQFGPRPEPPSIEDFFGSGDGEMTEAEQQYQQMYEDFHNQMKDAIVVPDLQTAAMAGLGGAQYGHMPLAGAMGMWGEELAANIPEDAVWSNIYEGMADVIGFGGGDAQAYGKNLHNLLRNNKGFQNWAAEMGIAVEDLLADVPKWAFEPEWMDTAMTGLFRAMNENMDVDVYKFLDHAGIDKGWTAVGTEWADLAQYAISKGMAGEEWNLVDYYAETWGVAVDEVEQYLKDHGIDPEVVSDATFPELDLVMKSNAGQINVLTPEFFDWLMDRTRQGMSRVIQVTEEEFAALPDVIKTIYSNMGYTFLITEEQVDIKPVNMEGWFNPEDFVGLGEMMRDSVVEGLTAFDVIGDGTGMEGSSNPFIETFKAWAVEAGDTLEEALTTEFANLQWSNMIFGVSSDGDSGAGYTVEGGPIDSIMRVWGKSAGLNLQNALQESLPAALNAAISTISSGFGGGSVGAGLSYNPNGGSGPFYTLGQSMGQSLAEGFRSGAEDIKTALGEVTDILSNDIDGQTFEGTISVPTGDTESALIVIKKHLSDIDATYASATVSVVDYASSVLRSVQQLLWNIDGYYASSTVTTSTYNYTYNNTYATVVPGGPQAEGGPISRTTAYLVGEEGPEIVTLRAGSYVHTADETQSILRNMNRSSNSSVGVASTGGGNTNITFGDVYVRNDHDIQKIADEIDRRLGKQNRTASRGMRAVEGTRLSNTS